ncbi:MAG: polyphosphate--AMP phosphotransferase [Eggerthellaceae bacterium]|nr:polyphosphate--AMP phosphotransferase [Eggerthellaceae bacterium]
MLEQIDFTKEKMTKKQYKKQWDLLMERLVVLQQHAHAAGVGLVVLFEGWNGAGKGSRISDLMYNLDARSTSVYVPEDINPDVETEFSGRANNVTGYYPIMQPFWKALGERNSITFFDRGWYSSVIDHMLYNAPAKLLLPKKGERHYLDSIKDFERMLVNDGYVVVKFFVHVTKEGQRERLKGLYDDPATRWRVSDEKMQTIHGYDSAYELYDRLVEQSDYDFAPWVLLNGEDKYQSNITIAQTLVDSIEKALGEREKDAQRRAAADAERAAANAAKEAAMRVEQADSLDASPQVLSEEDELAQAQVPADKGILTGEKLAMAEEAAARQHSFAPESTRFEIVPDYPSVDTISHDQTIDASLYKKELKSLQHRLFILENIMYQKRIPLMILYEGWDAAGKGGNIKRVAQALDARAYNIFPSPAPTKTELAHPHLWRYWTRLPKAGHVGMYDRTWYGRVLVERVEDITAPERWSISYDEINEFEHDLVDWGAILLKFWVDVSPEEQLRRFLDRETDPAKPGKITDDDCRNREKYPQYKSAIDDMFRLTSTTFAPWTVLESDDKKYARIKALTHIVDALETRLGIKVDSQGQSFE